MHLKPGGRGGAIGDAWRGWLHGADWPGGGAGGFACAFICRGLLAGLEYLIFPDQRFHLAADRGRHLQQVNLATIGQLHGGGIQGPKCVILFGWRQRFQRGIGKWAGGGAAAKGSGKAATQHGAAGGAKRQILHNFSPAYIIAKAGAVPIDQGRRKRLA